MAPGRTADRENSATRAALLDAAEQIMVEEGYAGVSTRRLAARAGANSALVYYYFGNMDNLFVELFRRARTVAIGFRSRRWNRRSRCGRCGKRSTTNRRPH